MEEVNVNSTKKLKDLHDEEVHTQTQVSGGSNKVRTALVTSALMNIITWTGIEITLGNHYFPSSPFDLTQRLREGGGVVRG